MKNNTMMIGAFIAGLATTYIVQKTEVFGSETRIFGADCNSQGYETNAPNGYSGDAASITLGNHPSNPNCDNPPCIILTYSQPLANGRTAHYFTGASGNPLTDAKRFAVQYDDTGYWIDKTVSANTADCDPICPSCPSCPSCPTCPTCPTCVKCDSCCPKPVPCPICPNPKKCPKPPKPPKCDSCCAECPDVSKPSKQPPQPPMGLMHRLFGKPRR